MRDILEALLSEIGEFGLDPTSDVLIGGARKADPARLANPLQPRRDVDAVAENVVAVDQDVAEIDPDAVEDALRLRQRRVAFLHHLLDQDRAFDRRDDRGEFQQHAVAYGLDQPAAERAHERRRRLAALAHKPRRAGLVLAHQARIADDVGG